MEPAARTPAAAALRIALAYAAIASLWILFSDALLVQLVRDPVHLAAAATLKGWGFVAVTAFVLYRLVASRLSQEAASRLSERDRVRSLELLEAIADASTDAIFAKDLEGRYLVFNREASRITGRARDLVIGRDDRAVFAPADAEVVMANDARTMREGLARTFEEHLMTVDGPTVFLASKGPLRDGDGRVFGLFGVSRDVTLQRRIEEALRESEGRLRLIMDNAPVAIAMFDRDMRYLHASRRWNEDFDLAGRDIVGLSHYDLFPGMPEELRAVHRRCLQGAVERCEADRFQRRDGTTKWVRWEVRPWHDAQGSVGGIIIFSEDITYRRQAEDALERHSVELEEEVRQRTSQLESSVAKLESFGYVISHDLRAPLRAISGFSAMLAESLAEGDTAENRRLVDRVHVSATHMNRLLEDIHAYSRADREGMQRVEVDLGALVRETLSELGPPAHVEVRIGELPPVRADETMMRQVLANLLGNAIKFSSKVEHPCIEVGSTPGESGPEIYVRDNGVGFDMRYAGQLFGLFKRLHRESDFPGTGLGLAIVRKLVERHGGAVRIDSVEGAGTTVGFTLG